MTGHLAIAVVGTVGFAAGAAASYLHLRRQVRWAPMLLRIAVTAAMIVNTAFIVREIAVLGALDTLRRGFDSTLLLATLIGLVGIFTHLSRTLRGLDGFLFIAAVIAQIGASTVAGGSVVTTTDRPWFVSHGLAFALGGALFAAAGLAGVAYLLVYRMLHRKRSPTLVGRVASLEALERFGRWTPVIGLPLLSYGILTGLCGVWHREDLSRTAWYLDPSFLTSLAAWTVYAYLCFGLMYVPRIRGRRAATLATCGLGLFALAFVLRELVSPMHQ